MSSTIQIPREIFEELRYTSMKEGAEDGYLSIASLTEHHDSYRRTYMEYFQFNGKFYVAAEYVEGSPDDGFSPFEETPALEATEVSEIEAYLAKASLKKVAALVERLWATSGHAQNIISELWSEK